MKEDPPLRNLLGAWKVAPAPDPDFKAAVWRRIAADRSSPSRWAQLRAWLLIELPTPRFAAPLLAMAAAVGLLIGRVDANRIRERYRREQARQYLTSIDPIAMMRGAPRR